MFWRFGGYANLSSLDSILDKSDVTLEEVLDENDTIAELRSQNAKLIDFLREEAVLQKLLHFVIRPLTSTAKPTDDPPQPASTERSISGGFLVKAIGKGRSKSRGHEESEQDKQEKQKRKYAYVSSEILSSDVWSISESLLDNMEQLQPFWDYLKLDVPLDNLQASYFTKVNEALIEKQPARMIAFLRSLDNGIPNMMKHVDCPMIMDLLLKFISLEKDPAGQGIVDWIQTQNLIPILISYITPSHPPSTQTAAGDFLKAIITISANASGQDASVIGPNELTRQLVSEHCLQTLVGQMLKGGNPLTVGVGIVIEVIRKNNSDYDSEIQIGPEPRTSDPIYLGNLLRLFSHHIKDFMELILSPRHTIMTETGSKSVPRKEMKVAWGDKIEPLGFDRFKTCELMAELLHCSNMGLLNEKGSEAEVRRRDTERERLKAEGRFAMSIDQQSSTDFGTSVDSSGFHHAEAFTPLGESPDHVKKYDVQTSSEDDGFEKVALTEAEPAMDDLDEKQDLESTDKNESITEKVGELNLGEKHAIPSRTESESQTQHETDPTETSTTAGKRGVSMLTLQIQGKDSTLSKFSGSTTNEGQENDRPAPLFIRRTSQPTNEQPGALSLDGNVATSQDEAPAPDDPIARQEANAQSHPGLPAIQREDDGAPVLGDLLKMMFVEHSVVPTILDFFFRFPWNNFLHNVVYDVVQQVFNGPMDRGYNAYVAVDLFETGRITEQVIEGQERSDRAQGERGMRLGYMGHLTLIAEEIVKFIERQPQETLSQSIVAKITDPTWVQYVEHTLSETRERDNAILGGVRPDMALGPRQAVLNAVNAAQGGFGNNASSALANAGLNGGGAVGLDSMDLANAANSGFSLNNNSLLSGFGSSDEEDDDLEEGPGGDAAAESSQQQIEDEEQMTQESASTDDQPTAPSPLVVPPSRARLQLAARLADKQRQAESSMSPPSQAAQVAATAAQNNPSIASPPKSALTLSNKPSSPVSTRRLRFDDEDPGGAAASGPSGLNYGPPGEVETMVGTVDVTDGAPSGQGDLGTEDSSSSSGDEEMPQELQRSGGGNEGPEPVPGLRRQTTRESLERTPLDIGDDDEDLSLSSPSASASNAQAPIGLGLGLTTSPSSTVAPAEPRQRDTATAEADAIAAYEAGLAAQRELEAGKKVEQERLLAEWGLADDEDEEDEDEPVSIGSKFLSRRGSGR